MTAIEPGRYTGHLALDNRPHFADFYVLGRKYRTSERLNTAFSCMVNDEVGVIMTVDTINNKGDPQIGGFFSLGSGAKPSDRRVRFEKGWAIELARTLGVDLMRLRRIAMRDDFLTAVHNLVDEVIKEKFND